MLNRAKCVVAAIAMASASVCSLITLPAHAATFDANAAFLDNEKPDGSEINPFTDAAGGIWAYGQASEPTADTFGTFAVVGNHSDAFAGNANIEGYFVASASSVPAVLQNTSGAPVATTFGVTLNSHEILLHPDASNAGVLQFTVPVGAGGAYDIVGDFVRKNGGGNGTIDRVLLNGSPLFSATLTTVNSTSEGAFTLPAVNLVAGDIVDFATFANGTDFSSDSTGFTATLTAVPEPATLSTLAVAAVGLLSRRRRA